MGIRQPHVQQLEVDQFVTSFPHSLVLPRVGRHRNIQIPLGTVRTMFAVFAASIIHLLAGNAVPAEAKVSVVGMGGVMVAPGHGGTAWATFAGAFEDAASGKWSVKSTSGRTATVSSDLQEEGLVVETERAK